MNFQMSPVSTNSHQLRDSLNQLYGKLSTVALQLEILV